MHTYIYEHVCAWVGRWVWVWVYICECVYVVLSWAQPGCPSQTGAKTLISSTTELYPVYSAVPALAAS